jgi:hypothetical protein
MSFLHQVLKPSLYREPLPCLETLDEQRAVLARKASALLGYSRLQRALPESEEGVTIRQVAEVFQSLGIEPLNTERVEKYQEWYTKRYGGEYSWNRVEWTSANLAQYAQPIPEFVLSRAVEIAEHLPGAKFSVEWPVRGEISRPDPFLVLIYKGLRYYIDVWDEPKFEGRRTI